MKCLSEEKKWSIYLFRLHGWQDREIAPVVDCSEKTVQRYRSYHFHLPAVRRRNPTKPFSITSLIFLNEKGFNDGDIAEMLGISRHLVKGHRVKRKIKASNNIASSMTRTRMSTVKRYRNAKKILKGICDV
tara:strand:+ start:240 stop:632 length:393 start_codon:yes stop_codon:yes gene_type:complete